ncbi:MAG: DUF3352 domain-containing protein [Candidatus Coatesbacteria bacterium]|nr:DUF3352 domain-containing protein [Candidatus Coatesbacteria bacterium]
MKKAIVIILILIVVGAGVAYYMTQMRGKETSLLPGLGTTKSTKAAPEPSGLLTYIPDTAALCVSFSDIGSLKTLIENSNYYKTLSSTPVWQKWTSEMDMLTQMALKNRQLEAGVESEPPDLGLIWKLLGDDIAIAFMPGLEPDAWTFAMVAKVKDAASLTKIVTFVKDSAKAEGFALTDEEYKGETVSKGARSEGVGEFYICETNGMLTTSTGVGAMHSVLDLISSGKPEGSLAATKEYKSLAGELKGGHLGELYMKLGTNMNSMFTSLAAMEGMPVQTGADGVPKMAGDSLTRLYLKDGLQFESYSMLDTVKSDPKIVSFYRFEPNDLPLLSVVPQDSTLVSVLNCLDSKAAYEMAIDSAMSQNPMAAVMLSGFITELDRKMGVSLTEDILPVVGPDVAFYFKGMSFKQNLPLPEFGFACNSSNPSVLYNAFPKVGDHLLSFAEDKAPDAKHVDEVYRGYPIHQIKLTTPIGDMSLAAAVVDDKFLMGFGREQVDMMIDSLDGEHPRFKDQEQFTSMKSKYPDKSNQIVYMDSESLWRQLRSTIELYSQSSDADLKETFEFVDVLVKPMKAILTTSIYEHPSENVAAQRTYGHIKIEAE